LLPAACLVVWFVAMLIPAARVVTMGIFSRFSWGMPIVFFGPVFAAILFVRLGRSRIKAAVLAASRRARTYCVHDLSGHADTGVCPECGRPFNAAADQSSWARAEII